MSTQLTEAPSASVPAPSYDSTQRMFRTLAKSNNFLKRLQLYSKGKAVNRRLIQPGQYGIPESDEEVVVLGDNVDVLVFAARPKALDTSGKKPIVNFDMDSEIFKQIERESYVKNSPCMFGITFLVFERSTGQFLEYFAKTKSARADAAKLQQYMPIGEEQVRQAEEAGVELSLQPAQPITMGAKLKEADDFSWHVMTVRPCSQPFTNLPPKDEIDREIEKFMSAPSTNLDAAEDEEEDEGGGEASSRPR